MTHSISLSYDISGGSLSENMQRDGFVFLKGWQPDTPSHQIVSTTGRALIFGAGSPVHRIVPRKEAAANTYSGLYGLNAFPFHSDMAHWRNPPRYLMLRCLKGHETVATIVADSYDLVKYVGEESLIGALVKPRRPVNGTIPLFPLYRPHHRERASLFRWDERFIVPASPVGTEGMNLVRKTITAITRTSISLCDRGDTLLVDNWRMLHARSAVGKEQTDRVIERAYLGDIY